MAERRYSYTSTEMEFIRRLPFPVAVYQYFEGFYHTIVVSEALQDIMHWSDAKWKSMISLDIPVDYTTRIDGSERTLEGKAYDMDRADSMLWYVVYRDVTKERKHQWRQGARLRFRQDLMNKILDNVQDCVFWKDTDRRFVGVNKAFLRAYGFDNPEVLIGKNDEEMGWHPDPSKYKDDEEAVLKEGKMTYLVPGECIIRGRVRKILASKAPLYENGQIVGLVGSFIDVTDKYEQSDQVARLAEEREIALLEAEQAKELMSSFIMRASHEMRTPLNAILGFTQLAKGTTDAMVLTDYINKIGVSGRILADLVNDILDIRKIDDGSMKLYPKPMIITDLLREIDDMVGVLAANKDVAFYMEIEELQHEFIVADKVRMQQILMNLLNNAVKFTDAGGTVTANVTERSIKDGVSEYTFVIHDTGCGMSEEFIDRIFTPFAQENRDAAKYGMGTGLGLTITKRVIDMMHGTIELETKENVGSTFTVRLPLTLSSKKDYHSSVGEKHEVQKAVSLEGKRILVVEDNLINQEVTRGMLDREKLICEMADNGQIAVDMIKSSKPGYYDAVLMDIYMPVMNGYESTRAIRKLDHPDALEIPILAMSAEVVDETIRMTRECGMNDYLSKPVEMDKLKSKLEMYIKGDEEYDYT